MGVLGGEFLLIRERDISSCDEGMRDRSTSICDDDDGNGNLGMGVGIMASAQQQQQHQQQQQDDQNWKVSWCHRMRNTRDHTEIDDLKAVLGLCSPSSPRVMGMGGEEDVLTENEAVASRPPMMRRSTTSKMHRALSKRSQSFVQSLTRTHTMRSGGQEVRPLPRKFLSHSATVQIISASYRS